MSPASATKSYVPFIPFPFIPFMSRALAAPTMRARPMQGRVPRSGVDCRASSTIFSATGQ
jgi:hypothetical protein